METQRPGPAETCDEFYAVGTAITKPSDDNSNEGRILLLKWDPKTRRLVTVDEYTTKGAVFSIQPFKGMLAAVSNNVLLLLGWERTTASSKGKSHAALHSPTSAEASSSGGGGGGDMSKDDEDYCLKVLCTHPTHVVSIGLVVQGDFLAVGDIMSSAALFKHSYDSDTGKHTLAEIARDHGANWTTAIAALPKPRTPADLSAQQQGQAKEQLSLPPSMLGNPTDERFIVGENGMNLFKVRQDTSSTAEYNRRQLKVEGRWHLGDLVNQIKPGSLVMDIPDPDLPIYPRLIYATLKGALGVVANIESNKCGRILDRLQANMGHLLPSVGCLPHEKWRTFENPSRTALPFGFIDGDLVETFLDLPMETQLYVFHGKRSPCATPLSVAGSPIQVESEGSGASVERLGRDDKGKDKMPEESPEAGGQRKRKEPSHTTSQEELAAQSSDNQGRDAVSRAADQLAGSSAHGFSMRASNLVQRPPNQRHFYLPDESPLANEVIKTVTDIGAEEHISLLDLIRMVESLSRLH
ncbi:DNA damage-binding protein 1a [Spiromyces aspiralis]|uniref:DNA damage-binding protein 1a n=1 Tax=Spiromyces aspiralis TaxID=68401 RepID=A0ACC1HB42_9FUNG|nr:DNA damage-binding protein 1a [Spiromyces aspiralis]